MINDISYGVVNCVIVKDLSRLGRNYIEVGRYIEQLFPLWNVRFIAINDMIDSYENPTSVNTIIVPFKNLINDEYSRDTSLKIKSALNGRRKRGEFVGAFSPYGYVKSDADKHKLVVDKEAASIVKKIFEWKIYDGLGADGICKKLNDMHIINPTAYKQKKLKLNYSNDNISYSWCPSTIRKILKNDVYIGNITQGKRKVKSYKVHKVEVVDKNDWISVPNMHEPIIDKDLFYRVQSLLDSETRVEKNGVLSMWAGLLKCGNCGASMSKKNYKSKYGKVYEYYMCGTYMKKSKVMCTKHTTEVHDIEQCVIDGINKSIKNIGNYKEILNNIELRFKKKDFESENDIIITSKIKAIERIKEIKDGLYEDWKEGYITKEEFIEYKKKYESNIETLNQDMIDLKKSQCNNCCNKCDFSKIFSKNGVIKLNRNIIVNLVNKIEIYENKKVKIFVKYNNE